MLTYHGALELCFPALQDVGKMICGKMMSDWQGDITGSLGKPTDKV